MVVKSTPLPFVTVLEQSTLTVVFVLLPTVIVVVCELTTDRVWVIVPVETVIVEYFVSYFVTVFVTVITGEAPSLLKVNCSGR